MREVAIIDYGVGNLLSLKMSIEFLGAKAIITNEEKLILSCNHIILPGVGAFSKAMDLIKNLHLDKILLNAKNNGCNILGICLGMQLLMNESEEFGINEGLKFINGKVEMLLPRSSKVQLAANNKYAGFHFSSIPTEVSNSMILEANCTNSDRLDNIFDSLREQFNK